MEIIKADQLSFAARAGALDGSLAYTTIFQQHRDLVSQTALSGLRGLEQILSETGVYGEAMKSLQEASSKIEDANQLAFRDPFQAASSSRQSQHNEATLNGLRSQGWPYRYTSQNIQGNAQSAVNGTDSSKPERGHANSVKQAADELELATAYLVNQGDPSAARYHATQARTNATAARDAAQQLWYTLNVTVPRPNDRLNATQSVINQANAVIDHANNVLSFVNTEPIAIIRGYTPTTHDLGDGYSLSTWGNSGYMTLTDANGAGILIQPNGNVNNLNGGAGWQFGTTSTFVLPNQTKITINPGSPADVLISRGIHAFTIGNVNGNSWPSVSSYTDMNGRDVDRSSNDGHILDLNGNAGGWRNGSNVLGDTGSREVIGTIAIINELRLDPTDVSISSDMQAFINEMGLSDYDYDGDGKLNNIELMVVADYTANYVKQIQDAYDLALQQLAKANAVLNELNELLDRLRKETDRSADSRGQENATAKSELQAIERRLVAALQSLQGDTSPSNVQGNIESSANQVLSQLTSITQNGGVMTPPSSQTVPLSPTNGTTTEPPPTTTGTDSNPDPIGDGLRRAGRLLSGILGGGNLNFLELPNQPTQTQENGELPSTAPQSTDNPLAALLTQLSSLDSSATTTLNPQDISVGLEALLTTLAQSGLFTAADQTGSNNLLGSITLGTSSEQTEPLEPSSLRSFLESLAQLGVSLKSSDGQGTTPQSQTSTLPPSAQQLLELLTGKPASSLPELSTTAQQLAGILAGSSGFSTGQSAPLSRRAEQLMLVLKGMAALGSAESSQSSNTETSDTPTAMELRLGLQSFLSAFSGLGVSGNPSTSQTNAVGDTPPLQSTSTQSISVISGNFQTDPELMKILQENLSKALQTQQRQLSQANTLFTQSQQIVQQFVTFVQQDDLVREVVQSDDLSDEQQEIFDSRMTELRKEWGMEWGSDDAHTPASQSNLTSRVMQSGMMV